MKPADLSRMYRINHGALHQNVEGLSHEDSLARPETGNCLNWVMAHIVSSRNSIHKAMGIDPIWPEDVAKRYGRGSAPVMSASEARPFHEIVRDLDRSQERILARFGEMSEADLEQPGMMRMNVGETLSFLQFHEAYHIGQTGLLRRIAGKEGAIR